VHVAVDFDQRLVYTSNWGSGDLSARRLNLDDSIGDEVFHISYSYASDINESQDEPHTHDANPRPNGLVRKMPSGVLSAAANRRLRL